MPPPRKIDLLPPEFRKELLEELRDSGFADYEGIAERLNFRLEKSGHELRIQKSAIHAFGSEYKEFVRLNEQSSDWAREWMGDVGIEGQAQRHNVLFQMLTTLAFKSMKAQALKEGEEIDPKELHFMGRMMKDIMSSSGIVQAMQDKEREVLAAKLDAAVASGKVTGDFRQTAREIMGFA